MGRRDDSLSGLAARTGSVHELKHPRRPRPNLHLASRVLTGILTGLALCAGNVLGASLRQMDLDGLIQNSHQIFRATILSVKKGSVEAGGGTIPTVTYDLKIVDSFKGQAAGTVQIRMVTSADNHSSAGGIERFPLFRDVPRLEVGKDYVLFMTRPSSLGLSTTVGLGQGCFHVLPGDDGEYAVNAFNNKGLGVKATAGPVSYDELARAIRERESR